MIDRSRKTAAEANAANTSPVLYPVPVPVRLVQFHICSCSVGSGSAPTSSSGLELHITLAWKFKTKFTETTLRTAIDENMYRVHTLSVRGEKQTIPTWLSMLTHPAPLLRDLTIGLAEGTFREMVLLPVCPTLFAGHAPSLKHLTLLGVHLSPDRIPAFDSVLSVFVLVVYKSAWTEPRNLLIACAGTRNLRVEMSREIRVSWAGLPAVGLVALPKLETLDVFEGDLSQNEHFTSYLSTPETSHVIVRAPGPWSLLFKEMVA